MYGDDRIRRTITASSVATSLRVASVKEVWLYDHIKESDLGSGVRQEDWKTIQVKIALLHRL